MNLEHLPILDHHAHAFFREEVWRQTPIEAYLSEAYDPRMLERFVPDNVFARRSYRELAGFYGCDPTREAVLEARAGWSYADLVKTMMLQTGIETILIDDGVWPEAMMGVEDASSLADIPASRVLRLETELASLVERASSVGDLLETFETHLRVLAPKVAGFKSVIAYRTGLDVQHHAAADLKAAFGEVKLGHRHGEPLRIANKALLDEALWVGLRVACEAGKPIQFHTGYGDPDLDLRLANPLHLRPLFESRALAGLNVVMLHCYPFVREAGFLASVYSGAYLDLGLTIPYMSTHAMLTSAREALHLAPITKVLFSTDASRTPELYWLGARHGRRVLAGALEATVEDGDLTQAEADWAAERILSENSRALYGLA